MARIRTIADVVRAFQRARGQVGRPDWGGLVLLVGAGCSASAGIPLGLEIAKGGMLDLARAYSNSSFDPTSEDEAFEWLKERGHLDRKLEWPQAYGELFESHFTDPASQRRVIRKALDQAKGINWAHVCIGELVRCRYVHTVLTTNFDQLALEGLVRAGLIPVVADGVEALSRIEGRPSSPQLVHLHGTAHTYRQRNSRFDVQETSRLSNVVGALRSLLLSTEALVVIGYAGGEEGVMEVLLDAAREAGEKTIYWVQHDNNHEHLSVAAQNLLGCSRGGGVVTGQDADSFFAEVARQLGVGVPVWMRDPVTTLTDQAGKLVHARDALIAGQVVTYQELLQDLAACLKDRRSAPTPTHQIDQAAKLALAGRAGEAQRVLDAQDSTVSPELLESLADAALALGRQASDSAHLEQAVDGYRRALAAVAPHHSVKTEIRLRTKHGEGLTLLGQRLRSRGHLQQASEELRRAANLADLTATPVEFAEAQRALGTALLRLGYREQGTALIEEGIEAYYRALQVYSRDEWPLQWAKLQNNVGNGLQKLAERTEARSRLREAVTAYRHALEVITREALPEEWAATLNNLGNALQRLGWAEDDEQHLTEAVAAYRASLDVYTASAHPLDWAMTQTNLGSALQTIGWRGRSPDAVTEALTAYRGALRIYSREKLEVDWARTKDNIGNALRSLGEIEHNVTRLEEAVVAHEDALQVYSADAFPLEWASSLHNLGVTLIAVAEQSGSLDRLVQAVGLLRQAQDVFTNSSLPTRWGSTQRYIARALLLQGQLTHDRPTLEAALAEATRALEPPIAGMVQDDRAALTATRDAAHRALQELDSRDASDGIN